MPRVCSRWTMPRSNRFLFPPKWKAQVLDLFPENSLADSSVLGSFCKQPRCDGWTVLRFIFSNVRTFFDAIIKFLNLSSVDLLFTSFLVLNNRESWSGCVRYEWCNVCICTNSCLQEITASVMYMPAVTWDRLLLSPVLDRDLLKCTITVDRIRTKEFQLRLETSFRMKMVSESFDSVRIFKLLPYLLIVSRRDPLYYERVWNFADDGTQVSAVWVAFDFMSFLWTRVRGLFGREKKTGNSRRYGTAFIFSLNGIYYRIVRAFLFSKTRIFVLNPQVLRLRKIFETLLVRCDVWK